MWNLIQPTDTNKWHTEAVRFLHEALACASAEQRKCIVLTHHAPLTRGASFPHHEEIHPIHKHRHPIHTAFATPLDDMFEKHIALHDSAWIFGHTHWRCDFTFNKTRILSNPLGYPQDQHQPLRFDSVKVLHC
jgi:hypothetical protein